MSTPTIEEGMVKFEGIELKDGRTILPGLTNSFAIYDALPWHVRNRHVWISGLLVLVLLLSQSITSAAVMMSTWILLRSPLTLVILCSPFKEERAPYCRSG